MAVERIAMQQSLPKAKALGPALMVLRTGAAPRAPRSAARDHAAGGGVAATWRLQPRWAEGAVIYNGETTEKIRTFYDLPGEKLGKTPW